MNDALIYGAYGYTGSLIVEEAVKKGYSPTVAGRNEELTKKLAAKHNLPYHCFSYDDQSAWDEALQGKRLLLNCAGLFIKTIDEILPACIRNKVHYADITGEIEVFTQVQKKSEEAEKLGVVLMPGVGFDVVPTDCISRFLYEQLPSATHLELAFDSPSGLSRGTALSLLNRLPHGSAHRVNGKVENYPAGMKSMTLTREGKDRFFGGIAWGDVFTAYYTTGIPNITAYSAMPPKTLKFLKTLGKFKALVKSRFVQQLAGSIIRKRIHGPGEEVRKTAQTYIWGKVSDNAGNSVVAELTTPESYYLTAKTAVRCAEKILNREVAPGYQTPAGAFGADFILTFEGVKRKKVLD